MRTKQKGGAISSRDELMDTRHGVPGTGRAPADVARLAAVPLKFLRFQAVRERTGLSRSTIWRLERQGVFPKRRRISANAVGWLEQDVNEWVLCRVQVS